MAELNTRQPPASALVSSSPRPSPLSRPHWPWSTYSHRPSSSASVHSAGTGTPSTVTGNWAQSSSTNWRDSATARRPSSSQCAASSSAMSDDSMRQWSFTAFEWLVRDVSNLRDFVEAQNLSAEDEHPEKHAFHVLKDTPVIGDQKFKLEIARTPISDETVNQNMTQQQTLSMFITYLMLDYPHADEISATIMAAIKCQDDRVGERGARPDWVWECWQNDWTFRQESEVWECTFPSLSTLLEHPRIAETDSFVICVQIHSPIGPFYPQQPSAYYVPRDLLEGLEASLDNANTGDVRFICVERLVDGVDPMSPNVQTPHSRRSSNEGSTSPNNVQFTGRKRIIYAHSDILTRRSEYFSTMLSSAFVENTAPPGERRIFTIVVEEADFMTIYWLLKWVYANWLLFSEEDDPRLAVDGMGTGWNANWLDSNSLHGEWDWKTVCRPGLDIELGSPREHGSVASVESGGSVRRTLVASTSTEEERLPDPEVTSTTPVAASHPPPSASVAPSGSKVTLRPSPSSRSVQSTSSRRAPSGSKTSGPVSPSVPRIAPILVPRNQPPPSYPRASFHPQAQSQRTLPKRIASPIPAPDPHVHPTSAPRPASALSVYQIAHRYSMPGLATLALEHIMSTITPKTSFPLLLASAVWDELHALVEDFVVERWDEVSAGDDFDRCCQEVAAGEWGPEGGKTLVQLFRRLRSPRA